MKSASPETGVPPSARSIRALLGSLSGPVFAGGGIAVIVLAILLAAHANALFYPLPNEDDARFFYPAWALAVRGTLAVPMLNAPDGIFWMPHGFYVWLAFWMRLFGPTMEVARAVCQATTAAAAAVLVTAFARLCRSRTFALLCGVLLVSPGVVFTANVVRMESLVFLLLALGLLLHTYELRLAAAAMLFLSVTVHPALGLGALLYAGAVVGAGKLRNEGMFSWIVIAAAVCAVLAEASYVAGHFALFHRHMAYQALRKGRHGTLRLLLSSRGVLLGAELAAAAGMLRAGGSGLRKELLPVMLLLLGLSTYAVLGREIPYNIYAYAVVPASFCCLLFRAVRVSRPVPQPPL